jgi:hypothetical protein
MTKFDSAEIPISNRKPFAEEAPIMIMNRPNRRVAVIEDSDRVLTASDRPRRRVQGVFYRRRQGTTYSTIHRSPTCSTPPEKYKVHVINVRCGKTKRGQRRCWAN